MIFSTPEFFVFFLVYILAHLLTPPRYRFFLILVGGTLFYGYWDPRLVWIPHFLSLIAYAGALWVDSAQRLEARRGRLTVAIAVLMLPLLFYKYTDFIWRNTLGLVFGDVERAIGLNLPLGISFITFSLIAYLVDTYSGRYRVERNPVLLANYVLFFPHTIAGPILRPHKLIPQLTKPTAALNAQFLLGFTIFSFGLLKKLVFADTMSETIDPIFAAPDGLHLWSYMLAIYGFSLQIYCDFSGYTDMAIGLALLLRVRLPTNFRQPYSATGIVEFWRRWHITLSNWLRDYLYIPLGGSRGGRGREILNIMITMVLGGLWHGASWNFAIWGGLHGIAVAASHGWRKIPAFGALPPIPNWLSIIVTFHFVAVLWVFFRAPDLTTAWTILSGLAIADTRDFGEFASKHIFPIALFAVFLASHRYDHHGMIRNFVRKARKTIVIPVLVFVWILAITISQGSSAKFIYFDF